MSSVSEVYARQLLRLGFGYPLWFPEADEDGEIEIGDVGYIEDGAFLRMFNITRKADDDIHQKYGVPDGFREITPDDWGRRKVKNAIPAGPLTGVSVKKVEFQAGGGASAAGFSGKFHCTENQGALLIMKDPATRERLPALRKLKNYVMKNIQSWSDFACDTLGLETREDEIWLVIGHAKTTQWAVSAVTSGGRSAQFSIAGDFGLPVNVMIAGEVEHMEATNWISRSGPLQVNLQHQQDPASPQRRRRTRQRQERQRSPQQDQPQHLQEDQSTAHIPITTGPLKEDQCVFLHYLKMKRRLGLFPTVVKAAAEPQEPSSRRDEEETLVEQVPNHPKLYDPVDFLLDYILERSQAEAAIASDIDLVLLCNGKEIPDDIPAFIREVQPSIEVGDDGFAMLTLDERILHEDNSPSGSEQQENPNIERSSILPHVATRGSGDEVLSWTSQDPRQSQLFNSLGTLYRFTTEVTSRGSSVTTLWRAALGNREDRVAIFEWSSNGGLGRAIIGKNTLPMSDLVRPDPRASHRRMFNGPDGCQYRWQQDVNSSDFVLQDENDRIVAFYRPIKPVRYHIGDVYGELHFLRSAGTSTVTQPPLMNMITATAMLFRFVTAYDL